MADNNFDEQKIELLKRIAKSLNSIDYSLTEISKLLNETKSK